MTYQFRVASPCSADWNQMKGDNRVRYCEQCRLNVYNFTAMTPAEINSLIEQREGRLCGRIYQRADGTVLTKNCPVGFRASLLRATSFATATLTALLSLVPPSKGQASQTQYSSPGPRAKPSASAVYLQIVDVSGGRIANALVTLRNESTNEVQTEKSNDEGEVRISAIAKGKYEITIISTGFRTQKLEHVQAPDSHLRVVQLDVAVMGEIVVIESRNPVKRFFSKLRHIS